MRERGKGIKDSNPLPIHASSSTRSTITEKEGKRREEGRRRRGEGRPFTTSSSKQSEEHANK